MPIIGSLFQDYSETTGQDPFTHQNKKLLKVQMGFGPVFAKLGSMVAYQGDVRFQNTGSGGLNKMLKAKMTGEGVNMMQCGGHRRAVPRGHGVGDPDLLPRQRHGVDQRWERAGLLRFDRMGHQAGQRR
ncbi:MAG: AIM24 family protein [Microthrixaceae bacterium]|nr:AIM24 family protein [Microthrixaceae bacterium]